MHNDYISLTESLGQKRVCVVFDIEFSREQITSKDPKKLSYSLLFINKNQTVKTKSKLNIIKTQVIINSK